MIIVLGSKIICRWVLYRERKYIYLWGPDVMMAATIRRILILDEMYFSRHLKHDGDML